ncbi:ATP-binding protein [Deltaproteobacteria bacterium OttesenSCG-928-K17]|nr:ATP-binding protein [Deltaproteobacteria bacterium OttesenSCG-928-K17]
MNMNLNDIENIILTGEEGKLIDYKSIDYILSNEDKKTDFIKDILSMANTPRHASESAFIFLGVKHNIGEDNDIVGLNEFRDEIHYQNILKGKLLNIPPTIKCHPLTLGSKKVLCIEICVDHNNHTPYVCMQSRGEKLLKDRIYYRVGSSNTEAIGTARENIHRWFADHVLPAAIEPEEAVWNDLKLRLLSMGKRHETILILPACSAMATQIAHLGVLSPYAVVDMDSESESEGSYKHMESVIKLRRLVHKVKPGDVTHFNTRSTFWYFARGFNDTSRKIEFSYKEWLKFRDKVFALLREICDRNAPKPLTFIMLVSGAKVERYEEEIIGLLTVFDNARIYIVTSETTSKDEDFFNDFKEEVSFLPVGIENFTEAVRRVIVPSDAVQDKSLPSLHGVPFAVRFEDYTWFNEYLDMCFLEHEFLDGNGPEKFRKGGEPTWEDMYKRYDCDRELTRIVIRDIDKSLTKRRQDRYNLYHSPGAGGSTVAKRILWDLHENYPVGELLTCTPASNVVACIGTITKETSNAMLLLIDSGRFNYDDIEKLYERIKSEQLPVVILQLARRVEAPSNLRSFRSKWLPQDLRKSEVTLMAEAYINSVPTKRATIKAVAQDQKQWQCISLGLAAYAENYQGISAYVAARLKYLSPIQKEIIAFLALAYYYGQQSMSLQFFAKLLQKNAADAIEAEDIFTGESTGAIDLLVLEDNGSEYRIMHQLIAKEILQQALSLIVGCPDEDGDVEVTSRNSGEEWKTKLSDFGREFAQILAENQNSTRGKDILYRVFIDRFGRIELSQGKPRYAMLFGDIPSEQGRLELFRSLSELFPHEAHIHAHMARVNGHAGDFETAKQAINKALELDDQDDVIHHIHGTILHSEVREMLRKKEVAWDNIQAMATEALEYYEKSRNLDHNKEHGYISAVELCISIVDSAKRIFNQTSSEILRDRSYGKFFLSLLSTASELLDTVHNLQVGSNASDHAMLCEGKLKTVHDDYSKALECYNNLLSRPDTTKPPLRRLIARTYGFRNGQIMKEFDQDTAEKIYHLMEANIKAEKNYSQNMPLWLKSARGMPTPPTLNRAIELVSYWKAESKDLNALFYLATLLSLQAIDGVTGALRLAQIALEECKGIARYNAQRTYSREWLANAPGIKGIIPHSSVGEWNDKTEFFRDNSQLKVMDGRILKISDSGKGIVTLKCGLNAFFIPIRFGVTQGKDENETIKFHLAFSYDGLIAWHLPAEE